MAKKTYLIMDGRANYDVDAAMIIEAFQAKSVLAAKQYLAKEYEGYDYVLVDNTTDTVIY